MNKYYRTKVNLPAWDKGAILEYDGKNYKAISDLWNTKAGDECKDYFETETIVENASDFFERVYNVSVLGKTKYLLKDDARKAHEELTKPKA